MAGINPSSDQVTLAATFDSLEILSPQRGRYRMELHTHFFQFEDFHIFYSDITDIFLLPEPDESAHTFVVVTLGQQMLKEQTLYSHIVLRVENISAGDTTFSMNDDILNETFTGLLPKVLSKILKRLSGARVNKPGNFLNSENGNAVSCSLKTEDGESDKGVMYPLELGFFFLPIPPTLILYNMIHYVSFERRGSNAEKMYHIDLVIGLKNMQEISFWNIPREDYFYLFRFVSQKNVYIRDINGPLHAAFLQVVDDNGDDDDDDDYVPT